MLTCLRSARPIGLSRNKYVLDLYMHMPFMFRFSLESIIILQSFLGCCLFVCCFSVGPVQLLGPLVSLSILDYFPLAQMIFHIIYCYRAREKEKGANITEYSLIEYSISVNIAEIDAKARETRPIKLYTPRQVLLWVCVSFWCSSFNDKTSGKIKRRRRGRRTHAHDTKSHGVVVIVDIVVVFFLLLLRSFFVLFYHLVSVLPVAFRSFFRFKIRINEWKCRMRHSRSYFRYMCT